MRNQHLLDFYRLYPTEYWLNKLLLLRNMIVHYDEAKPFVHDGVAVADDESFVRMLKMEVHFLYFQMVEALFDMVFAIEDAEDQNLWLTLSFAKWQEYSARIRAIADGTSPVLTADRQLDGGATVPFVQYLFFFIYLPSEDASVREANVRFLRRALTVFARDYNDRGDYNAFKHSLRLYHSGFRIGMGIEGSKNLQLVGSADDAITYLEKNSAGRTCETTKSFDPERDFRMACMCSRLIGNLINSRRFAYLGIEGKRLLFHEEDFDAADDRSFSINRASFTID